MATEGQPDYVIDLHATSGVVEVAISGELDFAAVPYLEQCLAEALKNDPKMVRIDVSGATFLDSVAIGVLVSTKKRVNDFGGSFSVEAMHPQVHQVLEIKGLLEYLNGDSEDRPS